MTVPRVNHRAQYHSIKDEIDSAIKRVLEGGSYIMNEDVASFEEEFAKYCGVRYAVSVQSGHDAILIALLALGVGSGDEVITVDNGCPSVPVAISHTGATPVFVDIDDRTYNIDPAKIEEAITPHTKVILPIHSYGQPYDVRAVRQVAEAHGLIVMEDASLAAGARYEGQRVGAFGDVGVFSLSHGKILNALGSAGIITTDRPDLAEGAQFLRRYGFRPLRDSDGIQDEYMAGGLVSAFQGYNSRLDAIQAAVLSVKLRKLDEWVERRGERARLYDRLLADLDVVRPFVMDNVVSTYRGYVIRVNDRNRVLEGLRAQGVQAGASYLPPLHMHPLWRYLGYREGDFPVTERVAREMISLPLYPELTDDQVGEVVEALKACVTARNV
jgi:dTDP-4-amino-4,6-dideoxygalactose transaminase